MSGFGTYPFGHPGGPVNPGFGDPATGSDVAFVPVQWDVTPVDGDAPGTATGQALATEYRDEGGQIVTLWVTGTPPSVGPYSVRVVSASGEHSEPCYMPMGKYLNESRELLRFALPPLPLGTYGLKITWLGGHTYVPACLLVLPSDTCLESLWAKGAWG